MKSTRSTQNTVTPLSAEQIAVLKRRYDEALSREKTQRSLINRERRALTVFCRERETRRREYEAAK